MMSEIPYQAPTGKLAAACGVAAAGAAAILTLFVLPAICRLLLRPARATRDQEQPQFVPQPAPAE